MEKNLETLVLTNFAMKMVLAITSQHQELLNKMELLKEKIKPWKKWLEPCFVKTIYQDIFRLKPLILLATL